MIIGTADVARLSLSSPSGVAGYLDQIVQAATRAGLLTTQLLTLGRAQIASREPVIIANFLERLRGALSRVLPDDVVLAKDGDHRQRPLCAAGSSEAGLRVRLSKPRGEDGRRGDDACHARREPALLPDLKAGPTPEAGFKSGGAPADSGHGLDAVPATCSPLRP